MTIPADSGRIDLWCSFTSDVPDATLPDYRALLSDSERQQEGRFYFERDRRRYVVTRALVRTVLSRYAPVAPTDWVFANNPYGKPLIANADPEARAIAFNVTHTDGLVILGVTFGGALGIDVENVRTRAAPLEVAGAFFAPEEVAALGMVPPARQPQRFYEYWTLKESYIKARGLGLSIPLDRFSFQFPADDEVAIVIHPDQNDSPARWRFWQFWTGCEHMTGVCAERTGPEAPRMVLTRIVPLGAESEIDCAPLRATAATARASTEYL